MNDKKFERFILKCSNDSVAFCWDLLDETGSRVVAQFVEDEDQGLSKEWGQYGWYQFPSKEQINIATHGKTNWDIYYVGI